METSLHHLYWQARDWKKYNLANLIRTHELSKQIMRVSDHRELHAHCPPTAPPSAAMARTLLSHIYDLPRSYKALDAVKSIYYELPDVMPEYAEHVGRQIPYLELSAKALRRRVV